MNLPSDLPHPISVRQQQTVSMWHAMQAPLFPEADEEKDENGAVAHAPPLRGAGADACMAGFYANARTLAGLSTVISRMRSSENPLRSILGTMFSRMWP